MALRVGSAWLVTYRQQAVGANLRGEDDGEDDTLSVLPESLTDRLLLLSVNSVDGIV